MTAAEALYKLEQRTRSARASKLGVVIPYALADAIIEALRRAVAQEEKGTP